MKWCQLKPLDLKDEDLIKIPWDRYYKDEFDKKQIVLHHTVSGDGTRGDLATWKKYKSSIATCVLIERDGTIQQLFSSKYWGYHLGAGNSKLDKHSIAIELDNWGGLTEKNGEYYATYGNKVNTPITFYRDGFRGYNYYESYSIEQLKAVGELLLLWNKIYSIPLDYNNDMWDISQKALNGEAGIWAHVSYRKPEEKQDCHPDPNLIDMLKTLSNI
jgi:N-acetyl-anhydromuramyl-L-alanine amidase AmpD